MFQLQRISIGEILGLGKNWKQWKKNRTFSESAFKTTYRRNSDLILRPFQLELKEQTNCGYKHNGTTHVVKFYISGLDVSYTPTYIFREVTVT